LFASRFFSPQFMPFLFASRFSPTVHAFLVCFQIFFPTVHAFLVCFQIFPGPFIVSSMVVGHGPAHAYVVGAARWGRGVLLRSSDGDEHDYHRVEQTVSDPRSFEFEQATLDPWPIHLQVTFLCSRLCRPVAYSFFFFHVGAAGQRREVVKAGDGTIFFGFFNGRARLRFWRDVRRDVGDV
jgi:hypothetical protein